jgi:hypothetical protein
VFERHARARLVLIQPCEQPQEHLLREVFLRRPAGQMPAHNANDQRVKLLDQVASRVFVAPADLLEA